VSEIPTLMLSGLSDPITPPSYTSVVAGGLANATVIEVPLTGHNVIAHLNRYSPGCGTTLMHAFFADPSGQVATLPCPEAIRPPDFVTRLRETPRLSRFFFGVFEGNRPILPLVTLLLLLWAAVAYPIAAVGRRIDRRPEPELARVRTLAWSGVLLSLGGAAVAIALVLRMATRHQMSILVGWLPSIAWAGWLALGGVIVSVTAAVMYLRNRRDGPHRIATVLGVTTSALASMLLFVFLVTIGAGPV
jgi:hypothetical protein